MKFNKELNKEQMYHNNMANCGHQATSGWIYHCRAT